MIISIEVSNKRVYFTFPGFVTAFEPVYYYLQDIGTITESTSKESGSATAVLALELYPLLGSSLGRTVQIFSNDTTIVFDGIITDIKIDTNIELQLEA
jgi:hypothetical protein